MESRSITNAVRFGLVLVTLLVAACSPAFSNEQPEYLQEDVRITGKEIHSFVDEGENVSVVVGDFRLTIGDRQISGRDAVIWVKSRKVGQISLNEILVYVQGKAKVVEPNGAVTGDEAMLVTLRHQGRISASGLFSTRDLRDFPLYRQAKEARAHGISPASEKDDKAGATFRPATPVRKAPPQLVRSAASQPAVQAPDAVMMRADELFSREVKEGDVRKRITIARGNVYLARGAADSKGFLELRSQSAVIFSMPEDSKASSQPGGVLGGKEKIVGVYLEGDVVIAWGERYFRGPRAYYDYTTSRSILDNAVFRTVQEQRNIPIYIRAEEVRSLSDTEFWFKGAKVSSCDFYTPSYHVGVSKAYLKDVTVYDRDPAEKDPLKRGDKLSEQSYFAKFWNPTFNVNSVPMLWWPYTQGSVTDGNTALRKIEISSDGDLGTGVNTEWHLFRLLGVLKPEGFKGRATLGIYEKGLVGGLELEYEREKFSGYAAAYGVTGQDGKDDFGDSRQNIETPSERSRVIWRHKQFLPDDWQIQAEVAYQSDRTFLEKYFPNEFRAGKDQETLIYAKKQRDNWVFDVLVQGRINGFMTQTESWPDVGYYRIGQRVFDTPLVWFSEQHAGVKRYRPDKRLASQSTAIEDSDAMLRLDTRQEIALPLQAGPLKVVPYAVGRLSYWEDTPPTGGDRDRAYGQVGVRASTHFWKVYDKVESRLWDLHGLRHVITPEAMVFLADSHHTNPSDLIPMDFDIERRISSLSGFGVAVTQRLQTKRGPNRKVVDWMRLKVSAGAFSNRNEGLVTPADGKLFSYRPEHSIGRNFVNLDYEWYISSGTVFLADMNYDVDRGIIGRYGMGLTVDRSPRLRYYIGFRGIHDLDSHVGTFGVTYKINRLYTIAAFEQYDFDFDGGKGVSTSVSVIRKFPRWYGSFSFVYDESEDEVAFFVNFWPEGVPEFRLSSGRIAVLGSSEKN